MGVKATRYAQNKQKTHSWWEIGFLLALAIAMFASRGILCTWQIFPNETHKRNKSRLGHYSLRK